MNICRYNQTGFCKFKNTCPNIHVNEICLVKNCSLNQCVKRHPKKCKYYAEYKYCKFRSCAFANSQRIEHGEVNELRQDIEYMKHEIGILQLTVQSLITVRQQNEDIISAICTLKEEIENIKTTNLKTESKIMAIEEEFEEESEDDDENEVEQLYSCQYCNVQIKESKQFEAHMKSHKKKGSKEYINWYECENSCDSKITLKKHINQKHQITNKAESESDGEYDLFQLEIVSDEEVYVCNLCDEGLDSENEVKKHLKETQKKVFELIDEGNIWMQ